MKTYRKRMVVRDRTLIGRCTGNGNDPASKFALVAGHDTTATYQRSVDQLETFS